MVKRSVSAVFSSFLAAALVLALQAGALAADAPRISPEVLKALIGNADVTVIDVRRGSDYDGSASKIKGAVRESEKDVSWASKYPKDRVLVLYCAWPSEGTSAGLARKLIDQGYEKVFALKGGWKKWAKMGFPVEGK